MSFSLVPAALRRQAQIAALWAPRRCLSSASPPAAEAKPKKANKSSGPPGGSSAPENTVLAGLAYLKSQPEVLALPDEEYPPWLWKLTEPKKLVDDGPGGKAEKARMRKENRERIRVSNFMKTQ